MAGQRSGEIAKKSAKITVPKKTVALSDSAPEFMKEDDGSGLDRLGPEDVYWAGDRKRSSIRHSRFVDRITDRILRRAGRDPYGVLEYLLLSIITAHPLSNKDDSKKQIAKRMQSALKALLGRKPKRGVRAQDDYEILLVAAWHYHCEVFKNKGVKDIDLAPIMRKSLKQIGIPVQKRTLEGEASKVRRLIRKFKKQKHVLLARVTTENEPDRSDEIDKAKEIATKLKDAGVFIDLTAIRPQLLRRTN